MSVTGVVLLVVMLLILRIVTQSTTAESIPLPEISEMEIYKQIESLEETRIKIQEEIARLSQFQRNATPYIPSLDEIDALQISIARLEGDIEKIDDDIKTVKNNQVDMKNRQDTGLLTDIEEKNRILELSRNDLQRQNTILQNQINEETKREQALRTKLDALKKEQAELSRPLQVETPKTLFVEMHEATDKLPYIVVYGKDTLTVQTLTDSKKIMFPESKAFFDWVKGKDRETEYMVLFVKPSRFGDYESIIEELKKLDFDVGFQVINEKTEITFEVMNAP
jgi:hypothetical protein